MRKDRKGVERGYPPDYVSAETLAYRLDCEVETIEALLRRGALPSPRMIGGLRRWCFASVRAFVEAQNAPAKRLAPNGRPGPEDDPFLAALTNGKADNRGDAR
jgi:excisionase family DNA binding protein